MREKTAIVLFNMGGPARLQDVRPFLRNLFADRAIINLPNPFRYLLAEIISRSRKTEAMKNYALMGGASPIVAESEKQARALECFVQKNCPQHEIQCFVAMRYWAPRIGKVLNEIKKFGAERIILLPLYPQYSTTTTGSFFTNWDKAGGAGVKTIRIENYATDRHFIQAHVNNILKTFEQENTPDNVRLILSAHGLPEKIIQAGDPYQSQVEQTCAAIMAQLPKALKDSRIAYQSRVGPLQWIGPSTLEEIEQAGKDNKTVMIVPVAFVSEHIETLVELDIDYRERAKHMGVATYIRVPALGVEPDYITCLGNLAMQALEGEKS